MHLQGIEVRVKQYHKGWVVEIKKEKNYILFKKKYWTHLISVSGIESMPWYFTDKDIAIEQASKFLKWDLIFSVSYL